MKSLFASAAIAAAVVVGPLAAVPADAGAPATHSAVVKPTRNVSSKVVKVRGHLVFKGHVSGDYAKHVVIIQKKNCRPARCAWHPYAKVRTNTLARYSQRIGAPRTGSWFWRAKVPATPKYATSYSSVWRTYTI